MPVLETRAYAKLNLSLDVLDRRSDGYHEMRMVMQTVTLSDALRLETGTGKPLSMRSSLGFLPADERNLAAAAALRLCAETGADCGGLSIELDKSIPVCAGLAGGSADAAAVLRGLNRLLGLGLPPERLEATTIRPSRAFRSVRLSARQRTAMISEATVMSKPSSRGTPLTLPPRPHTMLRSWRSFMSTQRFQVIRRTSMSRILPC